MAITLFNGLVVVAAGLSFVMAGIYFAFSGFIMGSFNAIGSKGAVDAMNSINKEILRSSFMPLFFGSSLFAILILLTPFFLDGIGYSMAPTVGALFYLIGMFGCTAVFNVPLNNRLLSAINPDKDLDQEWNHYFHRWTRWNHVRTVCCAISGGLYSWAVCGAL